MDVTKAMAPKSDQMNADDLISGPKTIRIRDVSVKSGVEQPVWVYYDGDDNKPWKPSKTSLRCLAAIWGADSSKWIGLHCTLYNDPEVTWGGMKVGGIRVSHMEGLTSPRTLMLTKTRGKKGATVIKPLERVAQQPEVNRAKLREDMAKVSDNPDAKRAWWSGLSAEEKAAVTDMANPQQPA